MFSYIHPEKRIPAHHPLRKIRELVREVLKELNHTFGRLYSHEGRPSIPPEQLLSALILQVLYSVRSERQLMKHREDVPRDSQERSATIAVLNTSPDAVRARGYGAGKKINGRKRHTLVDTDGVRGRVVEGSEEQIESTASRDRLAGTEGGSAAGPAQR